MSPDPATKRPKNPAIQQTKSHLLDVARACPTNVSQCRRRVEPVSDTPSCDRAGVTTLGYARVSTPDQDPALQHDALAAAGAERVWTDTASGARTDRPALAELLAYARSGDVLTVWKLDRLGRSLPHLLATVEHLAAEGVELRSLTEGIDTTTPGGRLVFHTLAAVAEFERDLGRERTRAGLAAARAAGAVIGRPKLAESTRLAIVNLATAGTAKTEIARTLGVSRSSVYRSLAEIQK